MNTLALLLILGSMIATILGSPLFMIWGVIAALYLYSSARSAQNKLSEMREDLQDFRARVSQMQNELKESYRNTRRLP